MKYTPNNNTTENKTMKTGDSNRLWSYCFLSYIYEHDKSIKESVYLPLVKRAMSELSKIKSYGTDEEISSLVNDIFGISMPILVARNMINNIYHSMPRRAKESLSFQIFSNGKHFKLNAFDFADYDDKINTAKSESDQLEAEFNQYISTTGTTIQSKSIVSLFAANKSQILKSITGKVDSATDPGIRHHAEFLENLRKTNSPLYTVAKNMFVGSIVAAVIESGTETDAKTEETGDLLLDTSILLSLLDLQDEVETKTSAELIALAKDAGFTLTYTNYTYEETVEILEQAIRHFDENIVSSLVRTSSVSYACRRRGLSKSDLLIIQKRFSEKLELNFGIRKRIASQAIAETIRSTFEYNDLTKYWKNESAAAYDAANILYTRQVRGGINKSFQKAKVWFVTENLRLVDISRKWVPPTSTPEAISTEGLIAAIWMKKPSLTRGALSDVGLKECISSFIVNGLPSNALITAISKIAAQRTDVSKEDYAYLVEALNTIESSDLYLFEEKVRSGGIEIEDVAALINAKSKEHADRIAESEGRLSATDRLINELNTKNKNLESQITNLISASTEVKSEFVSEIRRLSTEQADAWAVVHEEQSRNKRQLVAMLIGLFIFASILQVVNWDFSKVWEKAKAIGSASTAFLLVFASINWKDIIGLFKELLGLINNIFQHRKLRKPT